MGLDLGPALRQVRKERGISQKELAEMLEMTQANLSLTENGKKGVSQAILDRIEENLGVPAAVLLWNSLTEESVPAHKAEMFKQLKPAVDTLIASIFND
jgi:transcriptional regulator with XRE-family HTH domain